MIEPPTYIECACTSSEHVVRIHKDKDEKEIYINIHMSNNYSLPMRIWVALKYIFGYTCVYGHFTCILWDLATIKKVAGELNVFISDIDGKNQIDRDQK